MLHDGGRQNPFALPDLADVVAERAQPVYWSADHIRRGAAAYRECRSNDVYTIVRAVLEAAVRNQHDIAELLNDAPARQVKASAAVAHAAA